MPGTRVRMRLANDSPRVLNTVFDAFTDPDEYTFDKTVVPLRLAQYEGEKLVSRSQAKRVAHRFERFKRVELDFAGVSEIGQAFADELFRVFVAAHPGIRITPVNTAPAWSIRCPPCRPRAEPAKYYLDTHRGTKGGRERFIPIVTAAQREAIEFAKSVATRQDDSVSDRRLDLKQALRRARTVMEQLGITMRDLHVTPHGARHQYAAERYEELTGAPPPVAGGGRIDKALDKEARLIVADELGHGRTQITNGSSWKGEVERALRRASFGDESRKIALQLRAQMTTGLHTFVQYADDFDQSNLDHAIVEDMYRVSYLGFGIVAARVPDVKTANTGQEVGALTRRWSLWVGRHVPHGPREHRRVAMLAFYSPSVGARGEDICEICARRSREA